MVHSLDVDRLIENAAVASQNITLLDDPVTIEAIKLNVVRPFLAVIDCMKRGVDPFEICADGGVEAWMIVAKGIKI